MGTPKSHAIKYFIKPPRNKPEMSSISFLIIVYAGDFFAVNA